MNKVNRVSMSVLDEEVINLINASSKIFPITQLDVDNNLNPNNYEYGRVDKSIYIWHESKWQYVIADDANIEWSEIKNKPITYPPSTHVHDYSPSTHNHDDKYAIKTIEDNVNDLETRMYNIEHGYTEGHSHVNIEVLNSITQNQVDNWNTVSNKSDKNYVDTELAKKADSTTLKGHTDNTTIHVTQANKDAWNNKAEPSQIPTNLSQLQKDIKFITVSPTKPTDGSMWYKEI